MSEDVSVKESGIMVQEFDLGVLVTKLKGLVKQPNWTGTVMSPTTRWYAAGWEEEGGKNREDKARIFGYQIQGRQGEHREVNPLSLTGEQVEMAENVVVVSNFSAMQEINRLACEFSRGGTEVPICLWGPRVRMDQGRPVFNIREVTLPPEFGASGVSTDAPGTEGGLKEIQVRMREKHNYEILGMIHLHPSRVLGEDFHGVFSKGISRGQGDWDNTVELAFKGAPGVSEQQYFLTGVVTDRLDGSLPPILGFYFFDHKDHGQTRLRDSSLRIIPGKVKRAAGYFLQDEGSDYLCFVHSFDPKMELMEKINGRDDNAVGEKGEKQQVGEVKKERAFQEVGEPDLGHSGVNLRKIAEQREIERAERERGEKKKSGFWGKRK